MSSSKPSPQIKKASHRKRFVGLLDESTKALDLTSKSLALINQWENVENVLHWDWQSLTTLLISDKEDQCLRRAVVRSAFAYFEANIYGLKNIAFVQSSLDNLE